MAKGAICYNCGREIFVVYRCMKCKHDFCRTCFDTDVAEWLCLKCSRAEAVPDGKPAQGSLTTQRGLEGPRNRL